MGKQLLIANVSCGGEAGFFIMGNGEAYSFGMGMQGELGNGQIGYKSKQLKRIAAASNIKFKQISASASHCLAVTDTLECYSWGSGKFGKLGLSTSIDPLVDRHAPEHVNFF